MSSEMKTNDYIGVLAACINIFAIISCLLVATEVIMAFLGKASPKSIVIYVSWMVLGLSSKMAINRRTAGAKIALINVVAIAGSGLVAIVLWFQFPVNIILAVITALTCLASWFRMKNKN